MIALLLYITLRHTLAAKGTYGTYLRYGTYGTYGTYLRYLRYGTI